MKGGVFQILFSNSKAVSLGMYALEPNLGPFQQAAFPVCSQASYLPSLSQFPVTQGFSCRYLVHRCPMNLGFRRHVHQADPTASLS